VEYGVERAEPVSSQSFTNSTTKNSVMNLSLITPKRRHPRQSEQCGECGDPLTQSSIHDHMVEKHGYMRVGAQVFKRVLCQYKDCGAPGLYKVGMHVSCKQHSNALKVIAVRKTASYDSGIASNLAEHYDSIDKQQRSRDGLKKLKGSFHPLRRSA
jgi:hypothetical protein